MIKIKSYTHACDDLSFLNAGSNDVNFKNESDKGFYIQVSIFYILLYRKIFFYYKLSVCVCIFINLFLYSHNQFQTNQSFIKTNILIKTHVKLRLSSIATIYIAFLHWSWCSVEQTPVNQPINQSVALVSFSFGYGSKAVSDIIRLTISYHQCQICHKHH